MNLDLISATITAPGATGVAAAAVAGDSLQVKNARQATDIWLLGAWTNAQAVGFSQAVAPSFNDTTRGIRWRNTALNPTNRITLGFPQRLEPQELISLTQAGSAVAGDVETLHLLAYYADLPGINPNMLSSADALRRLVRLVTVEDTITPTAASVYTGARAINAASDLLRANTDYAVLGYQVGANCGCHQPARA